tara:strand:+ start:160 stop:351 length:192 start_codon:yes stop_codon:yes gene_type:complete
MFTKEILHRIALLVVWARHSKSVDSAGATPHELTQHNILQVANEIDSWLDSNMKKEDRNERKI